MQQSNRSRAAFWILAAMILLTMASSAVPSPIYPVYAGEWHLSPLQLTVAFAIYVAGLLASLLTAGGLSDYVGRRAVLAVGLSGVAIAMAVFVVADGYALLIVARVVQGLSVGLLLSTLGAALLDHSLESRPSLAGVLNGAIPPAALALGAISSGAFVEWGPLPEQLVYIVYGIVLVLGLVALTVVPESVTRRPGAIRSLVPTVSVPASSRALFGSLAGALVSSWALGGLYLSLMPSILGQVFGITNHFSAGAVLALFTGLGAATGLVVQRLDSRIVVLIGLTALLVGPVVTIGFLVGGSLAGVLVGTAIAGVGFGAGFQGALRLLVATASPTHRAGLLSTMYVVSYVAFGLPAVAAGLFEPVFGLVPVVVGYGVLIVLAAAVALGSQLLSRRTVAVEESADRVRTRKERRAQLRAASMLESGTGSIQTID